MTRFGAPFWRHLLLENWFAPEWFEAERKRLSGTGTVYKLPTRPVNGRSLNLVVKWSRVGEDVPAGHADGEQVHPTPSSTVPSRNSPC